MRNQTFKSMVTAATVTAIVSFLLTACLHENHNRVRTMNPHNYQLLDEVNNSDMWFRAWKARARNLRASMSYIDTCHVTDYNTGCDQDLRGSAHPRLVHGGKIEAISG
jgi:hypothetical protein